MERKTTDVCVLEANETGDSAADTSIPPWVARICAGEYPEGEYPEGVYPPIEVFDKLDPEPISTHFFFTTNDKAEMYEMVREGRKVEAEHFTRQYIYGPNNSEQRHCVWIDDACYWPEKSSGITWVSVHGADSICVVTWRGCLDTMRLRGEGKRLSDLSFKKKCVDLALSLFRNSIICEIEDLGDPSSELRQNFQKCIKKPFGVVSANPNANNSEASDSDEEKAIEFLKKKMKSDINFDSYETTKTAIHAFQHLFRKKVKADEIEVSILDPGWIFSDAGIRNGSALLELSDDQIEKFLDDTIGEMEIVNPIHNFLKKQRASRETYLPSPSPGCSSSISETRDQYW